MPSILRNSKVLIKELQEFINKFNPDIIHSHLWETEILLTKLNIGKAKRFTHFHDNMRQISKTKNFRREDLTLFYERKLFLKSKLGNVICISNNNLAYVKKNLPKRFNNKSFLLHNAINLTKFENRTNRKFNKINLITVGRLDNNKNQIFCIKILEKLKNKGYHTTLTILGDGPNKEDLINYTKNKNIYSLVKFTGNVDMVNEYLNLSNIYIHSALNEAFGLTIMEAMSTGLPVVSLDGKGNRDIIIHGKNGYIFKNQDSSLFANQIIELFEKEKLYEKISINGQNTAKNYDIINYVSKLLELYKQSISSTN